MTFHIPCQPLKLKVACMGRRLQPRVVYLLHAITTEDRDTIGRQDKIQRLVVVFRLPPKLGDNHERNTTGPSGDDGSDRCAG
jgi:hypothetical protein